MVPTRLAFAIFYNDDDGRIYKKMFIKQVNLSIDNDVMITYEFIYWQWFLIDNDLMINNGYIYLQSFI